MPKVVEKSPNNPATLHLPKRPSAKRPKEDQSFEHALKQAQPKRDVSPKPSAESPKPAQEEAPAEPGQQAAAPTDEQPLDATTLPVDSEVPAEEVPLQKHDTRDAGVEIVVLPVIAPAPDPVNVTPIADFPQAPSKTVPVEVDETQAVTPVIETSPLKIRELPDQVFELPELPHLPDQADLPNETDSLDDLAQPASVRIPAQQVLEDAVLDEEPVPVQKFSTPSTPIPAKQPVARNTQQAAPTSDLPDLPNEAIAPVDPVESDPSQVDDGAVKSEIPKLKLVESGGDAEAAEDPLPQQLSATSETGHAKESSPHTAVPRVIDATAPTAPAEAKPTAPAPLAPPPAPVHVDADFAATNHDRIVSSVRSQLLPNGGTMHLRLDPPELGALQIHVRMVDGVMQASFETSNDQATRLLSHSLSQLKNALETQGVSVDRLHVQQAPRDPQSGSSTEDQHRQSQQQDSQAQREQQRRELLNRMWRRMRLGRDPLDMVA